MLRWLTAGESHGPALVAVLEGLPAGVPVTTVDIATQLARRRLGYGRGARMKFEQDAGHASRRRAARAHAWAGRSPCRSATPSGPSGRRSWPPTRWIPTCWTGLARNAPLTRPRPGHADLAGMQKYGFDDARPVLERASARETAARVALGTVAQQFLRAVLGAEVVSHVVSIGEADAVDGPLPTPADRDAIDESPVRALHPDSTAAMVDRDRGGQGGRRHARRGGRGAGLRAAAGAGLVRARRPAARRPTGRRADGHPGDQGGRDRRRVRHGPPPRDPRPTTRSIPRTPGSPAGPTGPAAPKAA